MLFAHNGSYAGSIPAGLSLAPFSLPPSSSFPFYYKSLLFYNLNKRNKGKDKWNKDIVGYRFFISISKLN